MRYKDSMDRGVKESRLGHRLECRVGDITAQDGVDAVVNAANAQLRPGGGVAGALHRAAGPELDAACRPLAPIQPGGAVITAGYRLPNFFVIHCLGPVYGQDAAPRQHLEECYRNSLQLAESKGLQSIAFPAISTGAFGYPPREALEIAWETIMAVLAELESVRHIRFVLRDDEMCALCSAALEQTAGLHGELF